ncbi:MAG: hypothetical protein RBR42_01915 [Desulfomicrobium sp.]|nr:hypothetical protein [Desulfomicrobium sp.]NLV97142.1 hypothetical protein [Desulfovibrionales bacterium]
MKKNVVLVVSLVLTLCLSAWVHAATPLGGLAVAVSPDGKQIVAAGDNRVLYAINAETMEVTERVWLGTPILALDFTQDGSKVVAEDTDGTLFLFNAQDWSIIKNEPKAEQMTVSREANLVAGLDRQTVRLFSLENLSATGTITLGDKDRVACMALAPKGDRLAILLTPVDDDAEPKEKVPTDLKNLEADEFKLKNDGKTSRLLIFSATDGSNIADHKLYFSASTVGATLLFQEENILIVNYTNLNAQIDAQGEVTLFKLDNSYNYGIGVSADHQTLLTGGLAKGTYTKVENLNKTTFSQDRLPGWPEYFKSFSVAPDGTAYGATSGYRIVKIKPGGALDKSYPVF